MNLNTDFKIIEPITLDFAWIVKSIKIIEPITPLIKLVIFQVVLIHMQIYLNIDNDNYIVS